jgi:hypothetical protein
MTITTTPAPAGELGAFDVARERYEREHGAGDLALIDTANVDELRRRYPGLFGDVPPAELAEAHARQVDELAAIVEQYDAAHRRYTAVLLDALGDLHVALDELSTALADPAAGGAR